MTRGVGTGSSRRELWEVWIAGYEAAVGAGFWNERFDGHRFEIREEFERWLSEREEATS